MPKFEIRIEKDKEPSVYKSIYIKQSLVDQVEKIAKEHDTSFNKVVVSMIESCLEG